MNRTNSTQKLSLKTFTWIAIVAISAMFLSTSTPVSGQYHDPVVELKTTKGNIYIRVYRGLVPRTSRNFIDLVNRGFYAGTIFHRIENWCVQGGSPNGNPNANFVDPQTGNIRFIPLEINRKLSHSSAGIVAMARNNNPNSASCQFYILKRPMRQLDGRYAIFGRVLQGLNVVQNIRRGDRILSAKIVQSNRRAPGKKQTIQRTRTGPVKKFDPPENIPDSGF